MDFQEIISLIFFVAYIVYRYFLKGKSEDDTEQKPERTPRPVRRETQPSNSNPKKQKPSTFEEILKEFEKELGGSDEKPKEVKKAIEPVVKQEKAKKEYQFTSEAMQKAAQQEYNSLQSREKPLKRKTLQDKPVRKKNTSFDPAKAYMYKELLDRKHFKI